MADEQGKKTAVRVYLVKDGDTERLVKAQNVAQARLHVASRIKAQFASQDDLARLCSIGVKVETAGERQ